MENIQNEDEEEQTNNKYRQIKPFGYICKTNHFHRDYTPINMKERTFYNYLKPNYIYRYIK